MKLNFDVRFYCEKKLDIFERAVTVILPDVDDELLQEYGGDVEALYTASDDLSDRALVKVEKQLKRNGFEPEDIELELLTTGEE